MESAEKVLKELKREVEEKGLKLSITEGGKEGERNVTTSCRYLEERFQEYSKNEGLVMATSVETLGVVAFVNEKSATGSEREVEKKKCKLRFSLLKKNRIFPKKIHEDWASESF